MNYISLYREICFGFAKQNSNHDIRFERNKFPCECKAFARLLFNFEVAITTFTFGDYSDEVPPVPMPNTEVKLIYADDTWLATAR